MNTPKTKEQTVDEQARAAADLTLRFDPSTATPEALESFLKAAAQELTEQQPNLQVALGKIEMAQKISGELLRSRVSATPSTEARAAVETARQGSSEWLEVCARCGNRGKERTMWLVADHWYHEHCLPWM